MKSQGFFQTPQDIMGEYDGCSVAQYTAYPLPALWYKGGIEQFLKIKVSNYCVKIYILSTEDWSA